MMETVEDIPREAILEGSNSTQVPGELQQLNPAINIAGLIGHCALRIFVMGERGVEDPPEDRRGWRRLLSIHTWRGRVLDVAIFGVTTYPMAVSSNPAQYLMPMWWDDMVL